MKGIELINASAGSGKTFNLTARVVEKLKEEVAPEGLMATTFTNKAAAELRERIRLELLKHEQPDQAQGILDGFVGTVNSVCARLLKEYALEAGLSPALDVLPEDDGARLFHIAIASEIEEYTSEIEPVAKSLGRVGGGTSFQPLPDWRDDVEEMVKQARANQLSGDDLLACARRSWESLSESFGAPGDAGLSERLDAAVGRALKELEQIEKLGNVSGESFDKLKSFARRRKRNQPISWFDWISLSDLKTNKKSAHLFDEVKNIAGEVLSHPEFQSDVKQLIDGVFNCAAKALNAYESFKEKQGLMDFTDQETRVLDLARDNEAFRSSMRDRLQQLMVDEFQDTSPIQLALFLELNRLAGQSVWVGDPKQAIYAFRGADPQLMEEVVGQISGTSTLDESWRSREALVNFSNAVFSEVFHEMGRDRVCLNIPEQRRVQAEGGRIEAWHLLTTNKEDDARAIAQGVKNLLIHQKDIKPSDIAVLCRKNKQCKDVAAALEELGIRAAAAQGSLLETRECRLALAALRYLHDQKNTVALAEIVHLSPLHKDHGRWLPELIQEKDQTINSWMSDPLVAALDQAREEARHWTPLETLEQAISRVELMRTIKSWSNARMRASNLDELRGVCRKYLDQCRARRSAATVAGFIAYLKDAEPGQAQGAGEQTVQVLTCHRSKGLEWPVVILASLDTAFEPNPCGVEVEAAPQFDPASPLAGRSIRYWPVPFGKQGLPELNDKLSSREEGVRKAEKDLKESRRLLYVGMTRARDGLVFAMRRKELKSGPVVYTKWLDELVDATGVPLLKWPLQIGEQEMKIGDFSAPVMVREFSAEDDSAAALIAREEEDEYLPPVSTSAMEYPAARISPSAITAPDDELKKIVLQPVVDLGVPIEVKGNQDGVLKRNQDGALRGNQFGIVLGNAIHGFLGMDSEGFTPEQLRDRAFGLLRRWGIEESISVDGLLTIRNRLMSYIEQTYPNAKVLREWPILLRKENNQLVQGWVDMLLELSDGYVIIDHKTYLEVETNELKKHGPQLRAYKEAVEHATGKPVLATLLHLPVMGQVLDLS